MAFSRIKIKNFQSLKDVDIELRPLTVIVGASSSGKSAVLRALKILMRNSASTHFVTHGEKRAVISIEDDEGATVTLERGKAHSTYSTDILGHSESYPKSNKDVPEEVRNVLKGIPVEIEGELLNFAGQFDKPFLLDETPSKVAKVLGDLTNITILHDAVREANRRRLETNGKLKVRRADLAQTQVELEEYTDLPKRKKALAAARETYDDLVAKYRTHEWLTDLIEKLDGLNEDLQIAKAMWPGELSLDTDELDERLARYEQLNTVVSSLKGSLRAAKLAKENLERLTEESEELDRAYHEALVAAGECPVCGQSTKELESV